MDVKSDVLPFDFKGMEPKAVASARPPAQRLRLIDTGPSGFGAHAVALFLSCPHRFALTYESALRKGVANEASKTTAALATAAAVAAVGAQMEAQGESELVDALVYGTDDEKTIYTMRGSLVHAAISHYYAHMGAAQGGVYIDGVWTTDTSGYYSAEDAMEAYALRHNAEKPLADARSCWRRYQRWAKTHDDFRVIAVETVLPITLPSGHHHTARIDLLTKGARGIDFIDHKTAAKPKQAQVEYRSALQILGQKAIGRTLYGREWGNVWLNVIPAGETTDDPARVVVPPAPALERETIGLLDRARVAITTMRGEPPNRWQRTPGSHCRRCPHWLPCINGV